MRPTLPVDSAATPSRAVTPLSVEVPASAVPFWTNVALFPMLLPVGLVVATCLWVAPGGARLALSHPVWGWTAVVLSGAALVRFGAGVAVAQRRRPGRISWERSAVILLGGAAVLLLAVAMLVVVLVQEHAYPAPRALPWLVVASQLLVCGVSGVVYLILGGVGDMLLARGASPSG